VPSLLTIHNAGYQGMFRPTAIEKLLLPWEIFNMNAVEQFDTFNSLKGGIVYADAITAVSRRYAEEIKTPEFGAGLETVLRDRAGDMLGIINGVEYSEWDPAVDTHIAAHYSSSDMSGKLECRRALLRYVGLDDIPDTTPVLGIVSRLVTQKGFDIFAGAAEELLAEDVALVVLGSGERVYEDMFRSLQRRHSSKMVVRLAYDNDLAHKIEAGADIFLMPSRYEPCGLNQIYSLRYGTVPVVRATGGLDDTIEQWSPENNTGTGFKFYGTSSYEFLVALRWAMITFQNKETWATLQRNGMAQDFSWERAAKQYVAVYEAIAGRRG
jgi:starch synthase